jgi:hypothetical protein
MKGNQHWEYNDHKTLTKMTKEIEKCNNSRVWILALGESLYYKKLCRS